MRMMDKDGTMDDGYGLSVYVTSTTAHAHGWRQILFFD